MSGAVACFSANDAQEDPAGYLNGLTVEFEIDGVLNGKRAVAGMVPLRGIDATALHVVFAQEPCTLDSCSLQVLVRIMAAQWCVSSNSTKARHFVTPCLLDERCQEHVLAKNCESPL